MWTQPRRSALILSCVLSFSAVGSSQTPTRPKKILTPAQQEYQQQRHEVDTQRDGLRAEAKRAFDAEMAREKAGDCTNAVTTLAANSCYGREVGTTDQNLNEYEDALRRLTGLRYPDFPGDTLAPGPAGPRVTPEESAAEFDRMEQFWRSYLEAATKAALHRFDGGTGGPSFAMRMHLLLVRSHMAELDEIYAMMLRN